MTPDPAPRRKLKVMRIIILLAVLAAAGVGLFDFHRCQFRRPAASLLVRAEAAAHGLTRARPPEV